MTLIEEIVAVAESYAAARQLSLGRVSMLAFGDGQILKRLKSGSDLTTRRLEGAMLWFSNNWPPAAEWPAGVERPEPSQPAEGTAA